MAAAVLSTILVIAPARALTPLSANEAAGHASAAGPGSVSDANAFCPTGMPCGSYSASASASGAFGGSLQATVTLSGVPLYGGSTQNLFATNAKATLSYGIELIGAPNVAVPVTVVASLAAASASGYLSDQASLTISSQVGDYYSQTCYNGTCYAISPLPVVLVSGREYLVSLQASAYAEADGTAFASVDPTFVLDPAYASAFTLVGVPGAVASVPEPQSWALFIFGLGYLGAALRRDGRFSSFARSRP